MGINYYRDDIGIGFPCSLLSPSETSMVVGEGR